MTTTTTMTFDVFRAENRAGGYEDWVGEVVAETEEDAQVLAEMEFESKATHRLYVTARDNDQN